MKYKTRAQYIIRKIVKLANINKYKKVHRSNNSYYFYVHDNNDEWIGVRLSNHRTKCQTWVGENSILKYAFKVSKRISIVFEESKTENDIYLFNRVRNPIIIDEYIFDISNEKEIDLNTIINSIKNIENMSKFDIDFLDCEHNNIIGIMGEKRDEGKYHNIPKCKRRK